MRIAAELRDHGGRVIRIGGGPEQPVERAIGKFLFHYPEWSPWLEVNEGKVEIMDVAQRLRMRTRDDIHVEIRSIEGQQCEPYLDEKKKARRRPLKRGRRQRKPQPEQGALEDPG